MRTGIHERRGGRRRSKLLTDQSLAWFKEHTDYDLVFERFRKGSPSALYSANQTTVAAKKALAEISPDNYEEVNQDDLDSTNEYKQYSSPTIIYDGDVVIGYKSGDSSCTLLNMTFEEMKERIQNAKEGT